MLCAMVNGPMLFLFRAPSLEFWQDVQMWPKYDTLRPIRLLA